jgi:hypothetical protein
LPNLVTIKLSVRGHIIKTFEKTIWSGQKWLATAQSFSNKWESFAYPEEWLIKDNVLFFSRDLLEDPKNREDYLPRIFRFEQYKIDGDEVYAEIRLKNPMDITGIRCLGTYFMVGSKNKMAIAASINSKGCSSYARVVAGKSEFWGMAMQGQVSSEEEKEYGYERKFVDLSSLGVESIDKYGVLGLKTLNHHIHVYIDGKEVFSSKYKGELSEIIHIALESKVTSYMDWVKLSNSKTGKVVFFDDFERP